MKLLVIVFIVFSAQSAYGEGARDQRYGIAQQKDPVTSRISEVCDSWTDARKSACKKFTEDLKQKYTMSETPFPLLEERKGSELTYRLALEDVQVKPGEAMFLCEKSTVQDSFRLSGVDDVSVEEPKEKKITEDQTILPRGTLPSSIPGVQKKAAKKQGGYVLLADGESNVEGKRGCMLEKDIEKKFGKGCKRPKGDTGTKEDTKTCTSGLTVLRGVPFSDDALKSIKGEGLECFKEQKGKVQKNKKTNIAEKISLAAYVFCSDDAEVLKKTTQADRSKKEGKPDSDQIEKKEDAQVEKRPEKVAPMSSDGHRKAVGVLMRAYEERKDDRELLRSIFKESKEFGIAFVQEASRQAVRLRVKDYKEQIQRRPESRAHTAALYGGLCGLGEVKYCSATIRK
jgi:hypothetical protein